MGERDIRYEFADFAVYPFRLCFFISNTMVNNINNFGTINFYENNHSKTQKEGIAWSEKDQAVPEKYENILPVPKKGKYTEVRRYIVERCKFDKEFKDFYESHSRVELCMRLTDEFGWDVDEHALGVNMNRNR